jgi:hypothetical protein
MRQEDALQTHALEDAIDEWQGECHALWAWLIIGALPQLFACPPRRSQLTTDKHE